MKKDYLRPEAEIIDIITTSLMVTSPGDISKGEDNQDPLPGDAGKHRGEWGNVWGK